MFSFLFRIMFCGLFFFQAFAQDDFEYDTQTMLQEGSKSKSKKIRKAKRNSESHINVSEIEQDIKNKKNKSKDFYIRLRPAAEINNFTITGTGGNGFVNSLTGATSLSYFGPEYKSVTTPSGGMNVEVGVGTKYISIDTGLQVIQAGAQASEMGLGWSLYNHIEKDDLKLTYLAIPVMAKFTFNARHDGFFMKVGLIPMALMTADLEISDSLEGKFNFDARDIIEDYDLLVSAGLGWDLFVSESVSLIFSGQIYSGTADILKEIRDTQLNLGGNIGFGVGINL